MSASAIVTGIIGTATKVAKVPLGVAKGVVAKGTAIAGPVVKGLHRHSQDDTDLQADPGQPESADVSDEGEPTPEPTGEPVLATADLNRPLAPISDEPPIQIVERVLADEAADEGAGRATEPRGASRDEEHGEAALQRAEAEEIAEEIAEALPGGDLDVETPVGTTGADVGFNPDTAEADLQQPGTDPLLDPETAKVARVEAETLSKASDTDKG